jgi:DNA (cytosine-5)-methyltransferase 1
MNAVELFAGAGGLALGTSLAGFKHCAVIERDRNSCNTIRENNQRGIIDWPLHQVDVREFDFKPYEGAELLAGGPPCQPFSIGGKHKGHRDHRNLFPEAVRAVREVRPKVVMLENVKGLMRPSFARFFEYVILQISYPTLTMRYDETWTDHLSRLERRHTRGRGRGLSYNVVFRRINAADYGVPQKRERVFLVACRDDLGIKWAYPEPTHSLNSLLHSQWVSGEYWDRHKIARKQRGEIPAKYRARVARLRSASLWPELEPWRTVRDVIASLPDPSRTQRSIENHVFNPGARAYGGHTGSPIDEPAKTLKAGDHGVPGGENMLALPNGEVRYFTVRESARLQTFPDHYFFQGSWTETMRQLGNAVAVDVAFTLASSIRESLQSRELERRRNEGRTSV